MCALSTLCVKRSVDFKLEEDEQRLAKRTCSKTCPATFGVNYGCLKNLDYSRPALNALHQLGIVSSDDEELLGVSCASSLSRAWRPAEESAWLALGELNALYAADPGRLSRAPLLAYRSFTRAPKAEAFSKLCAAHAIPPEAFCCGAAAGPLHLRMSQRVLERAMTEYAEASIALSSLHVPEWLLPWCARWGFPCGPGASLTVCAVSAFPGSPVLAACPRQAQAPVRTVLVPIFPTDPQSV
uniref:Uncharacterized protein n=1 Tax=Tetraselmis sp. GSL018 TaxID=582737 RepID=A0A061RYB9_9CHLO|mmetsp:Transcript_12759/g.30243  ORF Transcript_12759/g.30243 Transcript_12759/m.30243 type:complete len:241 (-) Transcript_12759:260-982(-)